MILTFIDTLANDYELLAIYARQEADYCLYRVRHYKYEEHEIRAMAKEEQSYRCDSLRFQEEANRLRGTNARRFRQTTVSAGLPGSPIRNLPDGSRERGEEGPRNPIPSVLVERTVYAPSNEAGVLVHHSEAAGHVV